MLTEAEAKTKWCPMVRVQNYAPDVSQGNPPVNRFSSDDRCIASACMAWRYEYETAPVDYKFTHEVRKTGRGYCGAFGEPK